ncbi:hypothetical protein SAMN05216503_1381 [Polaribacter sp. KT25b]|uniref:DUF1853 family protein n=1 Tax=Polaribacter sp. KT25b TaxID=1855336 RepID=UPI00087C5AC3|nr:DUF1853 family protein [Polaribacter sp. KT25b]SDR91561.1 hypothetical protein SAMN05216503_1381 [Polaribacter sp. KT25b]
MHQKTKIIQKRYEGFLQTNCLWKGNSIYKLNQFEIEQVSSKINIEIDEKLRLGKYIERFVSYQLEQEKSIKIISENIQIQKEKITLGELDCIILKDNKPIHLEIIYKFYLHDNAVGETEIEHFIGPNRKDSLVEKLTKLSEKQLPLLYSNECVHYLKSINLNVDEIEQEVYFKAQLFVPFLEENIILEELNQDCIVGFYINKKELEQFKDSKFFIPNKKDWLIIPHQNVDWLNFNQFKEKSTEYLEREFSPFCWMKFFNGEIKKFFLVWW